ncbi:Gypsy retrotransposon integrase-like protein 1, partial [Mucuna pruriens]
MKYLERATRMVATFEKFTLHHVPREVDLLSKLATTQRRGLQRSIIHESISCPIIEETLVCCAEERRTWVTPLKEYLKDEQLSSYPNETKKLVRDAAKFFFPITSLCGGKKSQYVVKEVHEGVCSTYIGGRELANKIARAGYYWPTLKNDCMKYVKRCDRCQRFAEVTTTPPKQLHSITSPWPFYKWGVDILGPFPPTPRQVMYLIVTVDYFTNDHDISRKNQVLLLKENNIPVRLTDRDSLRQWDSIRISVDHKFMHSIENKTTVHGGHPKRATEVARGSEREVGRGAPQVLWSYHTMSHSSTNETPFCLTFGTEAVIPIEIGEPSPQIALFHPGVKVTQSLILLFHLGKVEVVSGIRDPCLHNHLGVEVGELFCLLHLSGLDWEIICFNCERQAHMIRNCTLLKKE